MSEADEVFADQVARRRATSWLDLQKDLDDAVAYEITGSDGVGYQFEALVSGMRRADFVKAPDDSFVGENGG